MDAVPYPWPFDGLPAPARIALVLVAPQFGFGWMDPAGQVGARCVAAREAAVRAGLPVVFLRLGRTAATPQRLRSIPPHSGVGWDWLPALMPDPDDLVIDAPAFDGFYETGMDAALWSRRIRHLVFAGFGTETAVHSTLREANDRGYECLVLEDGCADVEPALHRSSMCSIEMSGGIFGAYATCEAFLATLTKEWST